MTRTKPKTTSEEITETLEGAWTKVRIAKLLEISLPTLYSKLDSNDWSDKHLALLKANNIIKGVGRTK